MAAARRLVHAALLKHAGAASNLGFGYRATNPAVTSNAEGIFWTYEDLNARVHHAAHALLARSSVGGSIVSVLPNTAHNLLLQLACAVSGTRLVTAKAPQAIPDLVQKFKCSAWADVDSSGQTVMHTAGATGGSMPIEDFLDIGRGFDDGTHFAGGKDLPEDEGLEFAYYGGGAAHTSLESLLGVADATRAHLSIKEDDVLCCPVALNHTMGMGFGVLPCVMAGAGIVLPSPAPDASATMAALRDQQCTLLVADTHVVNALVEKEEAEPAAANGLQLRGGLVKVGSGEDISANFAREIFGATLDAVGKPR